MKKKLLFFFLVMGSIVGLPENSFSQSIGIGTTTPNVSAVLDITHSSKGLLIPRMTTTGINNMPGLTRGLMVYDSSLNQLMVNMGSSTTANWQSIAYKSNWNLTGNSGIIPASQFIGTTDNQPLRFRVNNIQAGELHPATGNIFWGLRSGQSSTTGYSNVAIGTDALKQNTNRSNVVAIGDSALYHNGNGASASEAFANTAIGSKTLYNNSRGGSNTAIGFYSLYTNSTGNSNTAIGVSSLFYNTIGSFNTAVGSESLQSNFTGTYNTALGFRALFNNNAGANTAIGATAMQFNVSGINNTATGFESLKANVEGNNNTSIGYRTLASNIIGNNNTAAGFQSLVNNSIGGTNAAFGTSTLYSNTTGSSNTAVGGHALSSNTRGLSNTAIGEQALYLNTSEFGNYNTAVGVQSLHATPASQFNTAIGYFAANLVNMGYNNTYIGANSDATVANLFNSVAIGESSRCTASNQVRLGNTSTSSIGGQANWTALSDGRFKKNIKEDVKGIDFIMKLRPVTYQLDISGMNKKLNIDRKNDETAKRSINDKEKIFYTGFVAQEVEQAAKNAGYDFSGVDKPTNENDFYGLRYSEFVVPLVKAVQEQQAIISALQKQNEELKKANADQKSINENLLKRLEKLEGSFNATTIAPTLR
jgi:hypothetical protein